MKTDTTTLLNQIKGLRISRSISPSKGLWVLMILLAALVSFDARADFEEETEPEVEQKSSSTGFEEIDESGQKKRTPEGSSPTEQGEQSGLDRDDQIFDSNRPSPGLNTSRPEDGNTESQKTNQVDKSANPTENSKPASRPSPKSNLSKKPIKLKSDGLKGSRLSGEILLKENVHIDQGDLEITCDEATIFFDRSTDEIQRVLAIGNVKMKKIDEISKKKIRASARRIEYLPKKGSVTMTGNVRIVRDDDIIKGTLLVYDINTGWISGKKIDGLVQPKGN